VIVSVAAISSVIVTVYILLLRAGGNDGRGTSVVNVNFVLRPL